MAAVAVVSMVCVAARFLLSAMHPAMPGLARWAWAGVLGTVASFIFAAHDRLPATSWLWLAQALIILAFVLAWLGFRQFLGRPALPAAMLTAIVAGALLSIGLAHAQPSQAIRSVVGSVLITLLSGQIALELLGTRSPRRVAARATGWLYVLNTAFFLARIASILSLSGQALTLRTDLATSAALLWMLGFGVATTLGMGLMTSERLQEELDHQISRDPLTGALNRRAFALVADKALAHCRRQDLPLAVLVMDLDHFKQINDRHGHAAGDRYLCRFVAVADRILRGEDAVCRFGGEEFVALLPETPAASALAAAERLRLAFAEEVAGDPSLPLPATVSIGVGQLQDGEDLESLLQRADKALYLAKHNGRNRCEPAETAA